MKKSLYVVLIILIGSIFISGCSDTKEVKKKVTPKEIAKSILDHEYYKGLTL